MKNKSTILEIFSFINRLYTAEEDMILWYENIPNNIYEFFYLAYNKEIEGKYISFSKNGINIYIVKDKNNNTIIDSVYIDDMEYLVFVVPYSDYQLRSYLNMTDDYTDEDKNKFLNVCIIYQYIFLYLKSKFNPVTDSSAEKLLKYSSIVLPLLSESYCGCYNENMIKSIGSPFEMRTDIVNQILSTEPEVLFDKGAIIGIIEESKK